MAIKDIPLNLKYYYESLIDDYYTKAEKAIDAKGKLIIEICNLRDELKENLEFYFKEYGFNLGEYKEYLDNNYIDGKLLRDARKTFITEVDLTKEGFKILQYANKQKDLVKLNKDVTFYDKILSIPKKQYREFMKAIFKAAQNRMLDGEGFKLHKGIGIFYIVRWKVDSGHQKRIDFVATAANRKRLLDAGIKVYDAEEAKWCKDRNIPYTAEDARVWKMEEYKWHLIHTHSKFKDAPLFQCAYSDYRGLSTRGKTQDELADECKTIEEVKKLDCDVRCKLLVALKVNPNIYSKFIRNETQTPTIYSKANSESR